MSELNEKNKKADAVEKVTQALHDAKLTKKQIAKIIKILQEANM